MEQVVGDRQNGCFEAIARLPHTFSDPLTTCARRVAVDERAAKKTLSVFRPLGAPSNHLDIDFQSMRPQQARLMRNRQRAQRRTA
jgi:hypothetical protein